MFLPLTRLCRDACGYCTFAQPPVLGRRAYMTLPEVLDVARRGAELGCTEALFTLGALRCRLPHTWLCSLLPRSRLACLTTPQHCFALPPASKQLPGSYVQRVLIRTAPAALCLGSQQNMQASRPCLQTLSFCLLHNQTRAGACQALHVPAARAALAEHMVCTRRGVGCSVLAHVDTHMSPVVNAPGDKPEAAHPAAAAELADMGHSSTLDYVAEAAGVVLAQTGLLPHVNAGVVSQADLARLRRVSASQARECWIAHACLCRAPKLAHAKGPAISGFNWVE